MNSQLAHLPQALPQLTDPLEQFLAGQMSESTQRAYRADIESFFQFLEVEQIDLLEAQQVTFHQVIAWRNALANEGYKRTTINRKLASVRAFYKVLLAAGYVPQSPADAALVKGYRQDNTPAGKSLSKDHTNLLLRAALDNPKEVFRARDTSLLYLLLYAGLRRSEATNALWGDLRQEGVHWVLTLPETKAQVPQEVKVQPIVQHYLSFWKGVAQSKGDSVGDPDPIFFSLSPNHRGERLTPQSINLTVKKYGEKAGLPREITAHIMRHTCCTMAIEGGAKPVQAQHHLRHRDIKTTMRYYEHRDHLNDNASDYIHP